MKNKDIGVIITALKQIMVEEGYSNLVIQRLLSTTDLSGQEKATIRQVVYGTVEAWLYLNAQLETYANKRMKSDIKLMLLAGLYELTHLNGRPDHVVVNRYVDYAKKHYAFASGFVNAILRRAIRQPLNLDNLSQVEYLSIRYSHPEWLVKHWIKSFGQEETKALLEANGRKRPLTIRCNTLKISPQALVEQLSQEGAHVRLHDKVDIALVINKLPEGGLTALKAFKEGLFFAQDVSSMLVGYLSDVKPGAHVLDLCAAPGGKTTHLAELVGTKGHITACDIHPHKLDLIEENAKRLGHSHITVKGHDALVDNPDWHQAFDLVLLDAPCSGLGIIGRKPEIKYRKSPQDINSLVPIQDKMLQNAAKYVKKGGLLIYSTCTTEAKENEVQVDKFLSQHTIFKRLPFTNDHVPSQSGDIRLRQSNGWSDGFYIARLINQGN